MRSGEPGRVKKPFLLSVLVAAATLAVLAGAGCGDAVKEGIASSGGAAAPAGQSALATGLASGPGPEGTAEADSATTKAASAAEAERATLTFSEPLTVIYDDFDLDASWKKAAASFITLTDGGIRFDGAGASTSGKKVTVTKAGTYVVSGKAADAQIAVDLEEKGLVKLVLNGVDLTCADSAPIYVKRADRTIITLAEGTENFITDGSPYVLDDVQAGEPNAAIFSKDDLTINGAGSLVVKANYQNGILSKDGLKIVSGEISVEAANDAIRGRDYIGVREATLTVSAAGDGLQSTNDVDPAKGFIDLQGGVLRVTAGCDGIQAETTILVRAADLVLTTGGGSSAAPVGGSAWAAPGMVASGGAVPPTSVSAESSASAKGLKAAGSVFVEGGAVTVDSADDALHAHDGIYMTGGQLALASGDDGLHADALVRISGGTLNISRAYEGIEAAVVTVAGGDIHVVASDDGINIAGGGDDSAAAGPRGADAFVVNENNRLHIDGGYVAVYAGGDGVDCNGRVFMTGGTVIVHGPVEDMNGALDYLGEFSVSGGSVVAAGSAGMAEAPSESSSECSLMINFDQVQAANTLVHVETEEGKEILSFAPSKEFQSVVVCSPDLREGMVYKVYLGGSYEGQAADGVYANGSYVPGTEYATVTLSGKVTVLGTAGMRGGGFPGSRMPPGGRAGRPAASTTTSTTTP